MPTEYLRGSLPCSTVACCSSLTAHFHWLWVQVVGWFLVNICSDNPLAVNTVILSFFFLHSSPQCNLWVSGLATSVRALDLQTLFSRFGQVLLPSWCVIVCIVCKKNPGCCAESVEIHSQHYMDVADIQIHSRLLCVFEDDSLGFMFLKCPVCMRDSSMPFVTNTTQRWFSKPAVCVCIIWRGVSM